MLSIEDAQSPTPRVARAGTTRGRLLEVAASAFAENGYAATSMTDLVRLSGLTRGAFYFHFDSKEELALAAFRLKQRALIERLTERLTESPGGERAIDRLGAALRIRAQLLREDPALSCMRRLCTELRSDPRLAPQVAIFHEEPIALLGSMIAKAQLEGDVRTNLPPERIARLIFATLVGMDELGEAAGEDDQPTQDLIDVLIRGLR